MDILKLKSGRAVLIRNGNVEFNLGTQSGLGMIFLCLTLISYVASIFSIGEIIITDNSNGYGAKIGWLLWFFWALAIFCSFTTPGWLLGWSLFWISVFLFLSAGFYILYISHNLFSFGCLFLVLIIIGHAGYYIIYVVKDDKLLVRLSKEKYEIFYRKQMIESGLLIQSDFEIRWYDHTEGESSKYCVIFLPLEENFMGNVCNQRNDILSTLSDSDKHLISIYSDLEDIFMYLGVSYNPSLWPEPPAKA